jgi:hypothetical protein
MATISLHIGLPHAGSTTIQHLLSQNRATLLEHGILYPASLGRHAHRALAAYALNDDQPDRMRERFARGNGGSLHELRQQVEREFRAEVEAAKPARIIISAEQLSWTLMRPQELARLRTLLAQHGEVDRIVIYLRRQSNVLISRYSNALKIGSLPLWQFPLTPEGLRPYDYARTLRLWSEAFGRRPVVRILEPARLKNGDLHDDVIAALDVPEAAVPQRPPIENEGLDVHSLAFLQAINEHFANVSAAKKTAARRSLIHALRQINDGPKLGASSWKLRLFGRLFARGNREIARDYFGRDELFAPDETAPRRASMGPLSLDDAMEIMARLWTAREDEFKSGRKERRAEKQARRRAKVRERRKEKERAKARRAEERAQRRTVRVPTGS